MSTHVKYTFGFQQLFISIKIEKQTFVVKYDNAVKMRPSTKSHNFLIRTGELKVKSNFNIKKYISIMGSKIPFSPNVDAK